MKKLEYPDAKEWADSVLQLAMANNKNVFEKLKEERFMCQALRELMADEIHEELYKAEERGAKSLGDISRRLLHGEDENTIRKSGVNEELLKMAVGVLQKQ